VPPGGRSQQPKHGLVKWPGPARARSHPGQAVLGPGQKNGPHAGLPCSGLHAHLYSKHRALSFVASHLPLNCSKIHLDVAIVAPI
jgi:hypothetical protein